MQNREPSVGTTLLHQEILLCIDVYQFLDQSLKRAMHTSDETGIWKFFIRGQSKSWKNNKLKPRDKLFILTNNFKLSSFKKILFVNNNILNSLYKNKIFFF